MSLAVAFQMDPIESVDIDADSSFELAYSAQQRGHGLYFYHPKDLIWQGGRVMAHVKPFKLERKQGHHVTFGKAERIDLATMDVIMMRQDPPFDMNYITATHLLERIHPSTLVVNDPLSVRNAPEKLFVLRYADLMPETLITHQLSEAQDFFNEFGDIIVKPLFGNGGAGVFRLRPGDENLSSLFETFQKMSTEPLMVQRYLPDVRKGDKRVILVDGKAAGAVNRVPADGEARANMHVGGRAEKTGLTKREHEICEAIGPTLQELGLIFVGIDVIGDFMTEINVTSPTGLQEIRRFDGTDLAADIWQVIERKRGRS